MVEAQERANLAGRPNFNAQAFFEAIPPARERAIAMLRTQVPADCPITPRAEVYITNGEWDGDTVSTVRFVSAAACRGRVGVSTGNNARFCGIASGCTLRSHGSSVWQQFKPGWFIPGGAAKNSGFFQTHSCPLLIMGVLLPPQLLEH